VQPGLDLSQSVAALWSAWNGRLSRRSKDCSKGKLNSQPLGVPSYDEGWDNWLVATGRHPKEVDHRDLLLHRFAEPPIVRRTRVGSHEGVIDAVVPGIDLFVGFPLIVIPDPGSRSWEHGFHTQQARHLSGLEDAPLGVDQRDTFAVELKSSGDIGSIEDATPEGSEAIHLIESRLAELGVLDISVHLRPAA
jgi:hypothetical protein